MSLDLIWTLTVHKSACVTGSVATIRYVRGEQSILSYHRPLSEPARMRPLEAKERELTIFWDRQGLLGVDVPHFAGYLAVLPLSSMLMIRIFKSKIRVRNRGA